MAQAFVTSYQDNFRWNVQEKAQPIYPGKSYIKCDHNADVWLVVKDLVNDGSNKESYAEVEATVKQMQLQRYISTYQRYFCKKHSKQDVIGTKEQEALGNELLESCKLLYDKKIDKVLPPLTTCRTINGYLRPSKLFTPKTTYQNEVGRVGYQIMLMHHQK